MKKIALLFVSLIITLSLFSQEDVEIKEMEKELQNQKDDTTNIEFKRKKVQIVEEDDETRIYVKKKKKEDWDWFWDDGSRFKGSWSGFSVGLSNLADKNFSISRPTADQYLDLNTGKSWNMNLNFAQYSINFINNKFGMVTGLGLEWNYYRFDNENSIQENPATGEIEIRTLDPAWNIEKSKFSTTYVTVPLLLEVHTSSSQSRGLVFSAGAIGGVKLGSNTKIIYKENGDTKKDKTKDDFNLSPFRYGVTARIGVGDWLIYGVYYFTPLFEKDKGAELYPFSVGIALSFE
ncbi:MAG TPA: outer membrane beta-barrel protein [Bacteroidales bacterium]|nr:outer membrane beta-barrel protein [Bacteroidales bacterium]